MQVTSENTEGTSKLIVNSISTNRSTMTGFYTVLYNSGEEVVATGYTPAVFTLNNTELYSVSVEDYGSYYFQYLDDTGSVNTPRTVVTSANLALTAVMCEGPPETCPNPTPMDGITVYENRMGADYWALCFEPACVRGTGPGATMYFVLENSKVLCYRQGSQTKQGTHSWA